MTYGRKPKYQVSANAERQKQRDFFSKRKFVRVDPTPLPEPAPRLPIARKNHWVLITVEPNCEALAVKKLRDVRFPGWFPMGVFWRTAGFVKRRRLAPVFPGYIFANPTGFPDEPYPNPTDRMLDVDHIVGIISDWEGRLIAHDDIIMKLDEAVAGGYFDFTKGTDPRTGKKKQRFMLGQRVMIEEGPFASFPAIVEEIDGDFVKVDVEIFGRPTPVQLQADQIRAA